MIVRSKEIADCINCSWIMEYTYYHNPEGEDFRLIHLGTPQLPDFELSGEEWCWIRNNFKYRTEEKPGAGFTRVHYLFEPVASQVA